MPRLSFSLRDVFWLTLVVGLALGWWVHIRSLGSALRDAEDYKSVLSLLFHAAPETCGTIWVQDGKVWIKVVQLNGTNHEGAAAGFRLAEQPVGQP